MPRINQVYVKIHMQLRVILLMICAAMPSHNNFCACSAGVLEAAGKGRKSTEGLLLFTSYVFFLRWGPFLETVSTGPGT